MHTVSKYMVIGSTAVALLLTGCNTPANQAAGAFPWKAMNNTGNNAVTQRTGATGVVSAQSIANHVVKVAHVENASVFVANDMAYVAVKMRPGATTTLTEQTKRTIIDAVKYRHPEIRRVMVTANPDAFQQFQTYGREVSQGRPVTGALNRFNAMVRRLWPQNA